MRRSNVRFAPIAAEFVRQRNMSRRPNRDILWHVLSSCISYVFSQGEIYSPDFANDCTPLPTRHANKGQRGFRMVCLR